MTSNGQEALELLESAGHFSPKSSENAEFDMVLMDIQMPVMGGVEAVQLIRGRENACGRRIPIVALTAHALPGHREKYLEAGMDEYVTKPIETRRLFEVMAQLTYRGKPLGFSAEAPDAGEDFERRRERIVELLDGKISLMSEIFNEVQQSLLEIAGREGPEELPLQRDNSASSGDSLYISELVDRLGGDFALLKDIICTFFIAYPPLLEELDRELKSRNWEALDDTIQGLKGMLANISARKGYDLCSWFEFAVRQRNLAQARSCHAKVSQELEFLKNLLTTFLAQAGKENSARV